MHEPLTSLPEEKSFAGKSYNKHPQWYNQPLRLTKEQREHPIIIFDDFFECYHLNEVREILWNWTAEVISSPYGISNDPHERNNHLYFYEKMEELAEACFMMKKKEQKRLRKQKRKKLKKHNRVGKPQRIDTAITPHDTPNNGHVNNENDEILHKPPQLIERVSKEPLTVISQVFKDESLQFLQDQLRDWQFVALSADTSIYEEGEKRGQVLNFIQQLHLLIDALYVINIQHAKEEIKIEETTTFLNQKQLTNPLQVVDAFFNIFPVVYIRRELSDLLESGLTFTGTYPDNLNVVEILYTYRNVLCLTESAYQILSNANTENDNPGKVTKGNYQDPNDADRNSSGGKCAERKHV